MSRDYPWIAKYSLYGQVPLHTSGVCARTSLQGCSMVFPSLQRTRYGFTRGVSLDHQGPPLAPCGSRESPLPYPLIPNQMDPKRVHSIRTTIDTPNLVLPHTTPGRTHIGSWLYYFHGWSLHEPVLRFGYDVYHRLPESTGQASNCRNPMNAVPNLSPQIPILHINREITQPTG
jgi:hypothetical protein